MRVRLGFVAIALLAVAGAPAVPAVGSTPVGRPGAPAFPPRANSVWAYDNAGSPGTWVGAIRDYNEQATPRHRLDEVYSYATDLEMYCPGNDGTQCTPDDLNSYYTPDSGGWASTQAYYDAFDTAGTSVLISPIIDGRTDSGGYMQGFNELSRDLASGFADKVAAQVCADPRVDGIQFDIEPFDVSTRNGQYWFYRQIAKDFAGRHGGSSTPDPYGCADAAHPQGRFFSVFTFASSIAANSRSGANVAQIMNSYGNGYVMDSLYDLSDQPAGTLNGVATYATAVSREARDMTRWADQLGIDFGFGIPASASAHEFTTCTAAPDAVDSCRPDATGATGYPMLQYAKLAVGAINHSGAVDDPGFIGTAVWDLGDHVSWNGLDFGPVPPPAPVLHYLSGHLPGAAARGPRA